MLPIPPLYAVKACLPVGFCNGCSRRRLGNRRRHKRSTACDRELRIAVSELLDASAKSGSTCFSILRWIKTIQRRTVRPQSSRTQHQRHEKSLRCPMATFRFASLPDLVVVQTRSTPNQHSSTKLTSLVRSKRQPFIKTICSGWQC